MLSNSLFDHACDTHYISLHDPQSNVMIVQPVTPPANSLVKLAAKLNQVRTFTKTHHKDTCLNLAYFGEEVSLTWA